MIFLSFIKKIKAAQSIKTQKKWNSLFIFLFIWYKLTVLVNLKSKWSYYLKISKLPKNKMNVKNIFPKKINDFVDSSEYVFRI